ncbi:MAG: ABC transporter ATP-binding protein [Treponema sp.]|jgi:ABC-type dipeptide/oligopeptide/nickel transport system ATPase component|nr:ABC transporter ATP-binding protein [Treponema sp.]
MLKVSDVTICFPTPSGIIEPVQGVSLDLDRGETLGLVGPSGCGKTVFCTALIGMLEHPGYIKTGAIHYSPSAAVSAMTVASTIPASWDLTTLSEKEWRHIRGKEIGMIFQNPMQALNHSRTIGSQFIEAIRAHRRSASKGECIEIAEAMLDQVMLSQPKEIMACYPFELSGGMCQRVMIAMALVHRPSLLIADEPTTALDTKNQAAILRLFKRIREAYHTAILFVSHDERVINTICDRVSALHPKEIVSRYGQCLAY